MQPYLEYTPPLVATENTYAANGEVASVARVIELPGMQRRYRFSAILWRLSLMVGDGVLLGVSLVLIALIAPRFHLELRVVPYELGTLSSRLVLGCLALASWIIAVRVTQAYELNSASNSTRSVFGAMCTLLLMLVFWVVLTYPFISWKSAFTRSVLLFLVVVAPILATWRIAFALIISLPRFRRRAVIVGVSTPGQTFAKELSCEKRPFTTVLGYISVGSEEKAQVDGLPVLGDKTVVHRLAQSNTIDMLIMAIDYKASPELFQEIIEVARLGLAVVPITTAYETMSGKIPIEHIGDQWYIGLPLGGGISFLYLCWRRVIDVVSGLLGVILLGLLLPILAPLIYFDSPGPIFFSQERMGRYGRTFRMHKFRSMSSEVKDSERADWVTKGDMRVTRVGRFMRATHLDELPQVLNILRGEMSLIGPRPERPSYVTALEKNNPFYCYRLSVKPGMTGWAQVKYGYGSGEEEELVKLQYDLYYIKHQSFLLDFCILLRTVVEVVLRHGV